MPSVPPKTIQINNIGVILHRHAHTRTLRLHIDPLIKKPIVRAPKHLPLAHIESFLCRHQEWIEAQLAPFSIAHTGDEILYQGKMYKLIQNAGTSSRLELNFDHDKGFLYHNMPPSLIKLRLKPWFKRQALELISGLCEKFAKQLGVSFSQIHLRDYKSRWGSCRQDGHLTFSWRLVMAPFSVLEYVCAHEVAHLVQMNHSPLFWQVVAELFPAYLPAKKWLKEKGKTLFYPI